VRQTETSASKSVETHRHVAKRCGVLLQVYAPQLGPPAATLIYAPQKCCQRLVVLLVEANLLIVAIPD
jgi:hypothetical protein